MGRLFLAATLVFWAAAAPADDATYSLAEVAHHTAANDCWMAIDGQVFDLSAYVPQHPANPSVLLPWCGKEASTAYHTKNRGRPHSPYADQLLSKYRIGALDDAH
jgi:cytochrome b involved in lipid metabolism